MELYQWNAFSEGAAFRRKDDLAALAQAAYLNVYWNNKKRPKSLEDIIKEIYKDTTKQTKKPDVDVQAFLEQRRRFGLDG